VVAALKEADLVAYIILLGLGKLKSEGGRIDLCMDTEGADGAQMLDQQALTQGYKQPPLLPLVLYACASCFK
jgi:hypothetical protein